jgi:hypothetical protein
MLHSPNLNIDLQENVTNLVRTPVRFLIDMPLYSLKCAFLNPVANEYHPDLRTLKLAPPQRPPTEIPDLVNQRSMERPTNELFFLVFIYFVPPVANHVRLLYPRLSLSPPPEFPLELPDSSKHSDHRIKVLTELEIHQIDCIGPLIIQEHINMRLKIDNMLEKVNIDIEDTPFNEKMRKRSSKRSTSILSADSLQCKYCSQLCGLFDQERDILEAKGLCEHAMNKEHQYMIDTQFCFIDLVETNMGSHVNIVELKRTLSSSQITENINIDLLDAINYSSYFRTSKEITDVNFNNTVELALPETTCSHNHVSALDRVKIFSPGNNIDSKTDHDSSKFINFFVSALDFGYLTDFFLFNLNPPQLGDLPGLDYFAKRAVKEKTLVNDIEDHVTVPICEAASDFAFLNFRKIFSFLEKEESVLGISEDLSDPPLRLTFLEKNLESKFSIDNIHFHKPSRGQNSFVSINDLKNILVSGFSSFTAENVENMGAHSKESSEGESYEKSLSQSDESESLTHIHKLPLMQKSQICYQNYVNDVKHQETSIGNNFLQGTGHPKSCSREELIIDTKLAEIKNDNCWHTFLTEPSSFNCHEAIELHCNEDNQPECAWDINYKGKNVPVFRSNCKALSHLVSDVESIQDIKENQHNQDLSFTSVTEDDPDISESQEFCDKDQVTIRSESFELTSIGEATTDKYLSMNTNFEQIKTMFKTPKPIIHDTLTEEITVNDSNLNRKSKKSRCEPRSYCVIKESLHQALIKLQNVEYKNIGNKIIETPLSEDNCTNVMMLPISKEQKCSTLYSCGTENMETQIGIQRSLCEEMDVKIETSKVRSVTPSIQTTKLHYRDTSDHLLAPFEKSLYREYKDTNSSYQGHWDSQGPCAYSKNNSKDIINKNTKQVDVRENKKIQEVSSSETPCPNISGILQANSSIVKTCEIKLVPFQKDDFNNDQSYFQLTSKIINVDPIDQKQEYFILLENRNKKVTAIGSTNVTNSSEVKSNSYLKRRDFLNRSLRKASTLPKKVDSYVRGDPQIHGCVSVKSSTENIQQCPVQGDLFDDIRNIRRNLKFI